MKRKFMTKLLEKEEQKKPAPQAQGEAGASEESQTSMDDVFDDTDVCRALELRRRTLVKARKEKTRGTDWAARGLHVGMTREWLERQMQGASEGLAPITENDGVVTVQLTRRFANRQAAGVRVVATGTERIVWVHDTTYMTLGEQFDCRWHGKRLEYVDQLNPEKY